MGVNNGNNIYNNGLTEADVKNIVDNLPEFQSKADTIKTVSLCDAYLTTYNRGRNKWFKIAERQFTGTNNAFLTWWDVEVRSNNENYTGILCCAVRYRQEGTELLPFASFYSDKWFRSSFKFVTRGLSSSLNLIKVELWASNSEEYTSVSIIERISGNIKPFEEKGNWLYTSYTNAEGDDAPTDNISTHTIVTNVSIVNRQHAIYNPTDNNLVSMDENGLIKNSGINTDVFTDDNGDQMTETPPQQYYVTGRFYFVAGKVCRCTAYSDASATFDVYGVVEALNYVLSQT